MDFNGLKMICGGFCLKTAWSFKGGRKKVYKWKCSNLGIYKYVWKGHKNRIKYNYIKKSEKWKICL